MTKKFKRHFTGHEQNGKGDWRRDTQVSEEEFARNWCRVFGHKRLVIPEGRCGIQCCLDCGEEMPVPLPK